jgi:hypothetical protein
MQPQAVMQPMMFSFPVAPVVQSCPMVSRLELLREDLNRLVESNRELRERVAVLEARQAKQTDYMNKELVPFLMRMKEGIMDNTQEGEELKKAVSSILAAMRFVTGVLAMRIPPDLAAWECNTFKSTEEAAAYIAKIIEEEKQSSSQEPTPPSTPQQPQSAPPTPAQTPCDTSS